MNKFKREKRLKVKLAKFGITQKMIADDLGVAPSLVCMVIKGERRSEKFELMVKNNFKDLKKRNNGN